jgi:hypothetical protein
VKGILKSTPELKAEALRRATKRGRANLSEAALITDKSQPTIRGICDRKEVDHIRVGKLRYIPIDQLDKLRQI